MTTPIPDAAVEAAFDAAEDALATRCHTGELRGDGGCECPGDDTMRLIISAALTAARPLMEAEALSALAVEWSEDCRIANTPWNQVTDDERARYRASDVALVGTDAIDLLIPVLERRAATIAERTNDEPA